MPIEYINEPKGKIEYMGEVTTPQLRGGATETWADTEKSGLNWEQRAKLSFARPKDRLQVLQNTFGKENVKQFETDKIVVKKDNQWLAVDPKGRFFMDIPGDIADIIGEIPELAGFTVGGIIGAGTTFPSGAGVPFGATIGAGGGAAGGKAVKQAIGQILGVYEPTTKEALTEQIETGAIAAVTQLTFAGASKLSNSFIRLIKEIPRIFSGISTDTLRRISNRGASKIFEPEKLQSNYLTKVSERASEGLNELVDKTHKEFGKIINNIVENNPNIEVKIGNAFNEFFKNLKKGRFVDNNGIVRTGLRLDPREENMIIKFLDAFTGVDKNTKIPLLDSFGMKQDLWSYGNQISKFDGKLGTIIKKFHKDLSNEMVKADTTGQLVKANTKYAEMENLKEILMRKFGISLQKTGLDITATPVSSLKSMFQKGGAEENILRRLDSLVSPEYKFVDDFLDGMNILELKGSQGFMDRIRKQVTEEIFRNFEKPIQIGTKVIPAISKQFQKVAPPIMKYGIKPTIFGAINP